MLRGSRLDPARLLDALPAALAATLQRRAVRAAEATVDQDYDDVQRKLVTNIKDIGSVPIGPLVSVFLFMSAVAHLLVV